MSQTLRRRMTMAEFLEWEERQEQKYEYDGYGPVVAMTGGGVAHALIAGNAFFALHRRLLGGPCRTYGSDLKVEVAGAIRYPDVSVICGPIARSATSSDKPVVLVEVLSPSTADTDFTEKHDEYRDTPSVRRYVILSRDRVLATVFSREDGAWVRSGVREGGTLRMPELGIEVPIAEFYVGIDFDAE